MTSGAGAPPIQGPSTVLYKRIGLALVPGAAFYALFIFRSSWVSGGRRRFTLFDDAMISMSYARTLSRTGELVWFEGAPRVEGFTNPLWTFVMAALHVVGLTASQISVGIMLIGLLCLLASAVLAAWLSLQLDPASRWAPVVTAFVVSLSYPLIFWSLRGMEVGLLLVFTLACLVCAVRWTDATQTAHRRRAWLAAAIVLIVLGLATRIDFVVIAVVIAGWTTWQAAPGAERRHTAILLGASIVLPLVVMTLARLVYYGEVVPNTYALKVSGASLWMRLERGIRTDLKLLPMLLLAGLGAAVLWRDAQRRTRRLLVLLAGTGLVTIAYSTYVGGDAWESVPNRYVATFVACAGIVAITGLVKAAYLPGYRSGLAAVAAVLFAFSGLALGFSDNFHASLAASGVGGLAVIVAAFLVLRLLPEQHMRRPIAMIGVATIAVLFASSGLGLAQWLRGRQLIGLDQRYADVGFALRRLTEPTARIAVVAAGAEVYFSDRPAVDLLGKSDPVIAHGPIRGDLYPGHNKWNYSHSIFTLRPDVVAGLWRPTTKDVEMLVRSGYDAFCMSAGGTTSRIFVRSDSTRVNRSMLRPAEEETCAAER